MKQLEKIIFIEARDESLFDMTSGKQNKASFDGCLIHRADLAPNATHCNFEHTP